MKTKPRRTSFPEWALHITALRERLRINQAELARRIQCSAMTISRWERGLLQPSAEHFIQLGNLGNKTEAWFFWEMGGVQPAKIVDALVGSPAKKFDGSSTGSGRDLAASTDGISKLMPIPVLKTVLGTQGTPGDKRSSLRGAPSSATFGVPASWCPHPEYTSLLRVKGHSMEPLIHQGDLVAVDSFRTDRSELIGRIIVASSEKTGLCVSRLRRYGSVDILEAEDRGFDSLVLSKTSRWRIIGKVLWWISWSADSL